LSTSASGHRLEVAATRRHFRLMSTRGVYTPRVPAAGGDDSTPAPVQDSVLSSTPIPSTAANIENLTIVEVVAKNIGRLSRYFKGGSAKTRRCNTAATCAHTCTPRAQRCDTAGVHVRTGRAALRHPRCARARRPRSIATPKVRTCTPPSQHCDTAGAHVHADRAALRHRRCARARRPRSIATPQVRTCALTAQQCDDLGALLWSAVARPPLWEGGGIATTRSLGCLRSPGERYVPSLPKRWLVRHRTPKLREAPARKELHFASEDAGT